MFLSFSNHFKSANFLLDGEGAQTEYTLDKGFCRHMINAESGQSAQDSERAITIKLAQQTIINNLRLLLWDKDDRPGLELSFADSW